MTSTNGMNGQQPERSTSMGSLELKDLAAPLAGLALVARGLRKNSVPGAAMVVAGGGLIYRMITKNPSLSQALGVGSADGSREKGAPADAPAFQQWITIGKPADELYQLWRDPETKPLIAEGIADVTVIDRNHARWNLQGPMDRSVSWEEEVVEDRPGELLRWKSMEGADIPNEGMISFRPAPRNLGTEVTLRVQFDPPGGAIGDAAVKVAEALPMAGQVLPGHFAGKVLRNFKSLAETGEIPRSRPPKSTASTAATG
jgi:uncharacterized membrane protein